MEMEDSNKTLLNICWTSGSQSMVQEPIEGSRSLPGFHGNVSATAHISVLSLYEKLLRDLISYATAYV